jgi:hypothetical protein
VGGKTYVCPPLVTLGAKGLCMVSGVGVEVGADVRLLGTFSEAGRDGMEWNGVGHGRLAEKHLEEVSQKVALFIGTGAGGSPGLVSAVNTHARGGLGWVYRLDSAHQERTACAGNKQVYVIHLQEVRWQWMSAVLIIIRVKYILTDQ